MARLKVPPLHIPGGVLLKRAPGEPAVIAPTETHVLRVVALADRLGAKKTSHPRLLPPSFVPSSHGNEVLVRDHVLGHAAGVDLHVALRTLRGVSGLVLF